MLKSLLFILLIATEFISPELKAESRSTLALRAFVPPSMSTNVKESKISSTLSLWLFSSQSNSRYPAEGQKFEVEGLDRIDMEAHIKKIVGNDHTIQHEILINRLKSTMKANKLIFLKISAN